MRYRRDKSAASSNNPRVMGDRRDQAIGLFKAMVMDVVYTDDDANTTQDSDAPEVLYRVMVLGGPRDGQSFENARDLNIYGGVKNYSERPWKKARTLTKQDPASQFSTESLQELNGDVVYISFLNGDPDYPVILGGAKHAKAEHTGATEEEGIRRVVNFNGIKLLVDRDGVIEWSKTNGAHSPLTGEFEEEVGESESVKVTLNNERQLVLEYSTGLKVEVDGKDDKISFTLASGAVVVMDSVDDSFKYTGKEGIEARVSGTDDKFNVTTKGGASVVVEAGDKITAKDSAGAKVAIDGGNVEAKDSTGAGVKFAGGKVAMGNSTAELVDLVGQLLDALTKEAPSGYGAPLTGLAIYTQLLTQLQSIKGSL